MKEEQAYIERVLSGDTNAYRYLVERYQTGLIIHCENIVKDREDAEDIAQETFIKAYRELANFKDTKARFSTWIYKIASNQCIDWVRKNKRKINVEDIEKYMETSDPQHAQLEEAEIIQKAIQTLEPPKYAAIIKAYFWEGKSYQAIAEEYDTTTGTIGTWLNRAKAQLKEKLS